MRWVEWTSASISSCRDVRVLIGRALPVPPAWFAEAFFRKGPGVTHGYRYRIENIAIAWLPSVAVGALTPFFMASS